MRVSLMEKIKILGQGYQMILSYGLDVIIDESPIIISHIRLLMHDLLQEMEPDIYSLQ